MAGVPRNVTQERAIRVLVRAGGVENNGAGKGSQRRVTMPNKVKVTIPYGTLKVGT